MEAELVESEGKTENVISDIGTVTVEIQTVGSRSRIQ
jgi:hypothetical protein